MSHCQKWIKLGGCERLQEKGGLGMVACVNRYSGNFPSLEQGMKLQLEDWWSAKQGCFKETATPLAPMVSYLKSTRKISEAS